MSLVRGIRSTVALVTGAVVLTIITPVLPALAATGVPVTGVASGRCLDVEGASLATGTPAVIWDCHGNANQRWTLTAAGELRAYDEARCLDAEGAAAASGGRPTIAPCDGTGSQRWTAPSGPALRHTQSGLCLDVRGAATANGSAVQLYSCHGRTNQQWRFAGTGGDTTPPSAPSGLTATDLTCEQVTLRWSAATDGVGVTAYDLYHDGQLVTTVGGGSRQARVDVVEGVTWGWYVNARDAAGNVSQASATVPVTPPACVTDTTPPAMPSGARATAAGTTVTLTWTAATDNVGVTGYEVRRDGSVAGSVAGTVTTFSDSGLSANRAYAYTVVALDRAGNRSAASAPARVTTGGSCAQPICGTTEVARDRDIPWGLVTLPDGSVLYARRDAHEIVRLDPATGATTTVGSFPAAESTDGEGGLMGLAVATDFASDPWLYVMHTTATDNRIVRVRYSGGRVDPATTQVLVAGILRNKYHNGGRLRFGPDGLLYAATGDAQNADYAQRLTGTGALNGKILRLARDGGIPAGNPFAGSYVWSYGHRNPQGLAFDSSGRLWQQEFGNSVMDETNLVVRGGNHGWPQCEGTSSQSEGGCGAAGLVAPKKTYPTSEGSCSGLTVVRDAVYIACGRGQRLYRHEISGDALVNTAQFFTGTYGRLRTVEPSADGNLWLTTTNAGDKDSVPNNSDERILKVTLGR